MPNQIENQPSQLPRGLAARETAVRVFMAVTLKNRPLDLTFDEIASDADLDPRDRAFALNLVMLGLRRFGSLENLLGNMLDSGLPRNATWTKAALILGLVQILLMRAADHANANLMVELVKRLPGKEKGFAGLVNAILRRAVREKDKLLKTLDNDPSQDLPLWLRSRWRANYGHDLVKDLALALRDEPALDISLKSGLDEQDWAKKLEANVMPTGTVRRTLTDVSKLEGYEDGDWWVQDIAASLPVKLLGDVEGKHVIDLCAAPGGKTMQLASSGAIVTAMDRSKNRLKRLADNLARTKLRAEIICDDAAKYRPSAPIDHILLDAPCSASGTYRRNPDMMLHKGANDIEKLAALQKRILAHAFSYLPVGGTLIYCVCSLEKEEGADQIEAFLDQNAKAKRLEIKPSELPGLEDAVTPSGDLLCLPTILAARGGMDGFFVSRLTRVA